MQIRLIALAVTALTVLQQGCATPGADDMLSREATAVMAPVHRFVTGFNAGDATAATGACTDAMSIIDEFPPYEWHGSGACSKWILDYDADAKRNGITDGIVTIEAPRHVDITADRAYVVLPANYTFKMRGTRMEEIGSTMTFALQQRHEGWRITGWSWSKN